MAFDPTINFQQSQGDVARMLFEQAPAEREIYLAARLGMTERNKTGWFSVEVGSSTGRVFDIISDEERLAKQQPPLPQDLVDTMKAFVKHGLRPGPITDFLLTAVIDHGSNPSHAIEHVDRVRFGGTRI